MGLTPRQNSSATPRDPNSALHGESRHPGTGDRFRRGELGTVIEYHSDRYTAKVRTERGRVLTGVPRLRSMPGDVAPLSPGTEVLLSFDYGFPIIMGVLAMPAQRGTTEGSPFSVTDQDPDGPSQSRLEVGNFRGPNEPTDLVAGDQAFIGQEGNSIGALTGGTNVMRSTPLSQVRTHSIGEMVEIISRNFRHVTDMGEMSISNTDGRVNMSFRGGTDQRSETGADEENWSIRMDLGSEGDLFNFELTTPRGQTLFRFHVDAEGHVEIFGINGVDLQSGTRTGGQHTEDHSGDSTRTVRGNRASRTTGSETRSAGSVTQSIDNDHVLSAGNDILTSALRDVTVGAGRNLFFSVQGGGDGENAVFYDVNSGDWLVDIGSSTNQNGNYHVRTVAGDMSFESTLGGDFTVSTQTGNILTESQQVKLSTSQPDSVILGGNSLASHLVKWEELQRHLLQLYRALDTHTHNIPGTATAAAMFTVTGSTGVPTVPIGSPLQSDINNFKSTKAGVSA